MPRIFLLFLFFLPILHGRDFHFHNLTIEEGLAHNSVTAILQDYQGFLWLGTRDGLHRYDGYRFDIFHHVFEDKESIPGNEVNTLFEDKSGRLWIGTNGGLCYFDRETKAFVSLIKDPEKRIEMGEITALAETDVLWVGTSTGLYTIKDNSPKIVPIPSQERMVYSLLVDQEGTLWLGLNEGLYVYKEPWIEKFPLNGFDQAAILALVQSQDGDYWVGTNTGLLYVDKHRQVKKIFTSRNSELASDQVQSLCEDRNGLLWVATTSGLATINPKEQQIKQYHHNPDQKNSLSHDMIYKIYEDHSGLIWLGTYAGLSRLDPRKQRFYNRTHEEDNKNSLSHRYVFSVLETQSEDLWVGTNLGLDQIKTEAGQEIYKHYKIGQGSNPEDDGRAVLSLLESEDGAIWIGSSGAGLWRYVPETDQIEKPFEGGGLSDQFVSCMIKDEAGMIWVGTSYGLNAIANGNDHNNYKVVFYYHDPEDPLSLSGNVIDALVSDRGSLWVGTRSAGLNHFRPGQGFTRYQHDQQNPRSLSHDRIRAILSDHQDPNLLWIGTDSGLNLLHQEDASFQVFRQEQGLPNNTIKGLLQDEKGRLWISTNNGLAVMNPKTMKVRRLDERDGLQSNYFNTGANHLGASGRMYFGGTQGLSSFYPHRIETDPYLPPVVLTRLLIANKPVALERKQPGSPLTKSLELTEEIVLSHQDNMFALEFSALYFAIPEKNRYAYKMVGYKDEWIETSANNRLAAYTNLEPGDYVFHVKAANNDGVWNHEGTSIKIKVLSTPWLSPFAKFCYGLIIIGLIAIYLKLQSDKLKDQRKIAEQQRQLAEQANLLVEEAREHAEHMERLNQLKDEFLANTSHELRTPLNGIIGIAESLVDGAFGALPGKVSSNLGMVISSGRRLSNLVNDILDFSKLKHHNLELQKKAIDLQSLVEMVLALSKPLAGDRLELLNEVSAELPPVDADEARLQQVLYNLVGNAIKFTESGSVSVRAAVKEGRNGVTRIYVTVEDTGIGIPEEQLQNIFDYFAQVDGSEVRDHSGTGLGLAITRELVSLHGGSIVVASNLGEGSSFTFDLPISRGRPQEIAMSREMQRFYLSAECETFSEIENEPGGYHILIVDDEPINLQVLENHLVQANYRVTRAGSGQEALDILDRDEVDMLLLDIMMPRMSGYEVCRIVRETRSLEELPIIMLTAKNMVGDLTQGFLAGASDYISKPFARDELLARIRTHLRIAKTTTCFHRFFPEEFLRCLNKEDILGVRLGDQIQLEMTVLFADIRSFTSLSEEMTPKETFDFLNRYLGRVSPCIRKHDGFVDKYVGDMVMALFPGDPSTALHAAIDMKKELATFNRERLASGKTAVKIGIGIHTGNLMLGTIGEQQRMEGTVISDAVNLASRLEGLTKVFDTGILFSEQTLQKMDTYGLPPFRHLGKVRVKGKTQAVSVYGIILNHMEAYLETRRAFEDGLALYYRRQFKEAQSCFKHVFHFNPKDELAVLYMKRCQRYEESGVPEDWDGVETMTEK